MKIVTVLENEIGAGGGHNQALNAISQMRDICSGRFEFEVVTTYESNVGILATMGIRAEAFSYAPSDRMLSYLSLSPWWMPLQSRFSFTGAFEKNLLRRKCDLVYLVTPSSASSALQRLNFITTIWDLCHRDHPEFPEVRRYSEFQDREFQYHSRLARAFLILTDSRELADSLSRRYGIDPERLLPMPFAPAAFLSAERGSDSAAMFGKYGIAGDYFFYPAQFWAHKNHVRILEALVILREEGWRAKVVFVGGDKGNLGHVENFIRANDLAEQVYCLGYVPSDSMRGLYEGCIAVIMPTYFGPTNLPPLEAWATERPLIYSRHLNGQTGDAAIGVNADDPGDIASAMRKSLDPVVRATLIEAGTRRLQEIGRERKAAESELSSRLDHFEAIRGCWA